MSSKDRSVADIGFARLDIDRHRRTGDPETVYGAGKTEEQIITILSRLHQAHPDRAILATRVPADAIERIRDAVDADVVRSDPDAQAIVVGPLPQPEGSVAVISAGTSDNQVAAEAALTVAVHGSHVIRISDVGVAGNGGS